MGKKEPKNLRDMDDDEFMNEVKKAVDAEAIVEIGKNSSVIKTALEQNTGEGKNN